MQPSGSAVLSVVQVFPQVATSSESSVHVQLLCEVMLWLQLAAQHRVWLQDGLTLMCALAGWRAIRDDRLPQCRRLQPCPGLEAGAGRAV